MARRRRGNYLLAGELNLTAMIDVAFQLLSFFIIATHPIDVLTNLDMLRPRGDDRGPQVDGILEVVVCKDGFVMQRQRVTIEEVERQMKAVASMSRDLPLVVKCTSDSTHNNLVRVLDSSAKAGLTRISVFSM